MSPTFKNILFTGILLGGLSACKEDPDQTKLQYFPDMADSPAFKTQGNYIDPPEGAVSRTAILYPETLEEAEKVLKNPFRGQPNEEAHLENGKRLFGIYCAPCHGFSGKGDGRITEPTADGGTGFPRPPDLSLDMYKKKQDGFYFYRATFGSALMPGYGHATTSNERWEINLYVTYLQNNPVVNEVKTEGTTPAATTTPDASKGETK